VNFLKLIWISEHDISVRCCCRKFCYAVKKVKRMWK